MAGCTITIRESVRIAAPPDAVWDYTQDYGCRPDWDASIRESKLTAVTPERTAEVRGFGLRCVFRYKVFDRPRRSSVVMEQIRSRLIAGGGGAWSYEAVESGTLWTQVNSIRLVDGLLTRALRPLIAWSLRSATRRAMARAGRRIEAGLTTPRRPRSCAFAGGAGG